MAIQPGRRRRSLTFCRVAPTSAPVSPRLPAGFNPMYGGATVSRRILAVQALPAAITLAAVVWTNANP